MRFATIQTAFGPRAALLQGDHYIDLHASESSLPKSVRHLIELGPPAWKAAEQVAHRDGAIRYEAATIRMLPPIPDPPKIVCLGLNYRDHALESGAPIPKDPVLFSKYTTALIGHEAPIVLPPVSNEVDYEAELVVVVGKGGRHLKAETAMSHVAGYTVGHDVSARDWQLKKDQKQWMVGKTFDTFAPTGPVLVTADEIPDPHKLQVQLRLNGTTLQNSNTKEFIFGVPHLLWYLSQCVTLEPGDLIFTGTPPGVGIARNPPVLLKPGDVAEVEIEKIGVLKNSCVAES